MSSDETNSNKKDEEKKVETGESIGISCCGICYAEKTSDGDYNVGVSLENPISKGISNCSPGAYAELTYNRDDGFSIGCGTSFETGFSLGIKNQGEIYQSNYAASDYSRYYFNDED